MEQIGFTWDDLVGVMYKKNLDFDNMTIMVSALLKLMEFFVEAANMGCPCFDFHGGNVGFIDDDMSRCVIVDWYGNDFVDHRSANKKAEKQSHTSANTPHMARFTMPKPRRSC